MKQSYFEQVMKNLEQGLREYESMINAYEIWLQAWRARMLGYEGYDEPEMCKALEE